MSNRVMSISGDSFSDLRVDLKLTLNSDFVMFGGYKCRSSAVHFDGNGIKIQCVADRGNSDTDCDDILDRVSDVSDDCYVDESVVEICYTQMTDFRYGDDKSSAIVLMKPNQQSVAAIRSILFMDSDIQFDANSLDERVNHIIVEIKKTIRNANDTENCLTPKMTQMVDAFFSFLKFHTILKVYSESETRDAKKLLYNALTLNRVYELTKEVKRLRNKIYCIKIIEQNSVDNTSDVTNTEPIDSTPHETEDESVDTEDSEEDSDEEDDCFEAKLECRIENFSELCDSVTGDSVQTGNHVWNILAKPYYNDSHVKKLAFYLQCDRAFKERSREWSCDVYAELSIVSQFDGKNFTRKIRHRFCAEENDWGFRGFLKWFDILNPENGFIKDGAITLSVWLTSDVENRVL